MSSKAPSFDCPALTVDELSRLMRINKNTLYDLIKAGRVPGAGYLGRSIRIHGPTVLAWLQQGSPPFKRDRRHRGR